LQLPDRGGYRRKTWAILLTLPASLQEQYPYKHQSSNTGREFDRCAITMAFSSSSTTSVMEMEPIRLAPSPKSPGLASSTLPSELTRHHESTSAAAATAPSAPTDDDELPPPSIATSMVQRWNYPRRNVPKVAACFWSFVVMGANDAAYGVSICFFRAS
jgi:hypothetical protein